MKKKSIKGFVLAETLIVSMFVAGVLIFLFIQFSNLSKNYIDSYKYNSIEDLYSLKNIRDYIEDDIEAWILIKDELKNNDFFEMTNCEIFSNKEYCLYLLEVKGIKQIYITENNFDENIFLFANAKFKKFSDKIKSEGLESYRIIAEFNNSKYATIRFGG